MAFVSGILTLEENLNLTSMTRSNPQALLLYKATRDGFEASSFHSKCDGKANTVTIIKSNYNNVFGGYTSAAWSSFSGFISDANAFIFSLRRNGVSYSDKFRIRTPADAIFSMGGYGPTFGAGADLSVADKSNVSTSSNSDFGYTYYLPSGYSYGTANTKSFLAGTDKGWLTTEIEVFQIKIN
jgi:hypothetical protein